MGVPVVSFDDFRAELERVGDRSVVFGFLLYDSRPSQAVVARFAQDQAQWIDELARGAGIYFFFPFRKEGKEYRNPSPEVMRIFGLGTSRLPGIILFAPPHPDGTIRTEHAVYLPLKRDDFGDPSVYEPVLEDLFDLVGECLAETDGSHAALVAIQNRVGRLRRRRTRRGFAGWIRKGAHMILFQVPRGLYGPFAEGFGRALGGRAAGG